MSEVKTLRIKKSTRIFLYIGMVILLALSAWLGLYPFIYPQDNMTLLLIFIPLSLVMLGICIAGLIETLIYKVEISGDGIAVRSLTGLKKISFADMKGFRILETSNSSYSYLMIFPVSGKKKVKITTFIEKIDEIYQMLDAHQIKNLDSIDYAEETQKMVNDREIGETEAERLVKIKEAKLYSNILNIAGIIAAFWAILIPRPYETSVIVCLVLPLVALFILFKYKKILSFDEKKNSPRNSIASAFFIPAVASFLRAILDYSLIDIKKAIIFSSGVFVFMAAIFIMVTFKEFKKKIALLFIMLPFIFSYSWAVTVQSNCLFDNNPGDAYKTVALDKRVSTGKHTSYYIKIAPAGPVTKEKEVSVSRDMYSKVNRNDELIIYIFNGTLKIKWLYLHKEG